VLHERLAGTRGPVVPTKVTGAAGELFGVLSATCQLHPTRRSSL
jgi:membrane associated rhomboid family serine protease